MKKVLIRVIVLLVVVGAGWGGYKLFQRMPQRQTQVASTKVRQGDVVVKAYARGELRAVRSSTLVAPNLFGTVQVTRIAALGAFAREKDLVVEFDDSEVQSRVEEKQLELDQLDEQIKKSQADLAISTNQDQVELLRDQYAVRRAELDVKRNELISKIDAQKNLLTLEEARRRLRQLESDIQSRQERAKAELNVLYEQKNKANVEMGRERQRLMQVKLLAPMSGLVALRQNIGGGFRMMGMQLPDLREGDQVSPGMPVADVLDLSELEVNAKVGELDRANLKEDQDVVIALDAVPEKKFHGKIKSMSGTASSNFFSGDPAKKFDVTFSIDMRQLLKELGASEDQIRRVLATAEENRKKPVTVSMSSFAMGGMTGGVPGGMAGGTADVPGAVMVAGVAGGQGEEGGQASGGGGRGGRRGMAGGGGGLPGMADMSDEDRQKMRAAFQKALGGRNMQDLSQEERQKILTQAMQAVGRSASGAKPAAAAKAGGAAAPSATGGPPALLGRGPAGAPSEGSQGGQGGEARARRGGEGRGGQGGTMGMLGGSGGQFTPKDLENAKLPAPPEEESQLDVLIRPGLLTDVEIIVEKVPNAIHIPNQAVFERGGKLVAYVQQASGRWEEREIKPLKRSESTMVIASGLKPGETVALADPNERPGEGKKKKQQQQEKGASGGGGGTPMGGMGAGGKGGK
jgi:multidrug efflux pump subunit AcrA (membrane-fusion protein)